MSLKNRSPIVEMRSIKKCFLDTVALKGVNFTLYEGEICALLGENGAGKTTLMNVLFGYYACDDGEIYVNGEKVTFSAPRDAIAKGIGMVHQHFALVPSISVLENIVVGMKEDKNLFLDMKEAKRKLLDLEKMYGLFVDPDARVETLSVGEQQKVEILKALYRGAKILILDEPTAVLAPLETKDLFATLRKLTENGNSVIFISHKLYEVMEISDRIVVLRNGEIVAERHKTETNMRELASLMVGGEIDLGKRKNIGFKRINNEIKDVLRVNDLWVMGNRGIEAVKGVTFSVKEGEILGIAGVSGNGQRELAECLFGIRLPEKGEVYLDGLSLAFGNPFFTVMNGMGRIPEDRIDTGLMMDLSVEDNIILEMHAFQPLKNGILLNYDEAHRISDELIQKFSIKTAGRDAPTKTLSGGNLQKIILARVIYRNPRLIIAAQPTRGLDVGAIDFIHDQLIVASKSNNSGILLISEDLDEVFSLSDRIAVMYEGRFMGIADIENADRETIGLWMSGVKESCA